jgi:NCAIR mutase (PurE)-related protein
MHPRDIEALLRAVREGRETVESAVERLKLLSYEDIGFAKVDHHRALRRGFGEVVFGSGKTPEQIGAIVERIATRGQAVLVTRAAPEAFHAVAQRTPAARYEEQARCIIVEGPHAEALDGLVTVVSAGTSDGPVAEEAAVTAAFHGARVERVHDVGVAGLHRLLDRLPVLREADVVIAVAGMEGALPSVVGGLVEAPVIAVPTSVGYGASFGGLAALLAMLNSCASGLAVVNIDNGFGAGYLACSMLRMAARRRQP